MDISHHRRHSLCPYYILSLYLIHLIDHSQMVRSLASLPCHASIWLCDDALVLHHFSFCSIRTLFLRYILLHLAFDVWYLRRRTYGMSLHLSQPNAY